MTGELGEFVGKAGLCYIHMCVESTFSFVWDKCNPGCTTISVFKNNSRKSLRNLNKKPLSVREGEKFFVSLFCFLRIPLKTMKVKQLGWEQTCIISNQ